MGIYKFVQHYDKYMYSRYGLGSLKATRVSAIIEMRCLVVLLQTRL